MSKLCLRLSYHQVDCRLEKFNSKKMYSNMPNKHAVCLLFLKIFSYQQTLMKTYMVIKIQIIFLPTITSEATPSATQFIKGLIKLDILPDCKHLGLLCLAFATLSKIGPDFIHKKVLKLKLSKNHFNKKCAPKLLFFKEKKLRKFWKMKKNLHFS